MYTVKSSEDFMLGIKALDQRLANLRLNSVEIDKNNKSITYKFICDVFVDDKLREKIKEEARKISDKAFETVDVRVSKIVSELKLVNSEIFKFFQSNFPSVAIFMKPTDIKSEQVGEIIKYTVRLNKDTVEYVNQKGLFSKVNAYLERTFCSNFVGATEEKTQEETIDLKDERVYLSQLEKIEKRTIKVPVIRVIDDKTMGQTALYLEDFTEGEAVITGEITDIAERQTKNGKPFFIIHLDDRTDRTSGVYFSKASTVDAIRSLKVGDGIIARATIGDYQGRKSLTFNKINGCEFPKDFVKQDRYKKTPPKEYGLIFPTKAESMEISSVFDEKKVYPDEVMNTEYVVFDLETTGTEVMNNGITEIGAVKISKGVITEQFTTLVKPDYKISAEITELTGIDEEMVKDAPKIGQVIPDFMKFIEGATVVAHNADFDTKFIRRFANAEDYEFKNKVMDTMFMAREKLPKIGRFDLETLAKQFNVVFNHHRALDDAIATAQIFLEMMRL